LSCRRGTGEGQEVVFGVSKHGFDLGELAAEYAGDDVELEVYVLGVGLGEDGAERGDDHPGSHVITPRGQ
jgi:hypothetical protein